MPFWGCSEHRGKSGALGGSGVALNRMELGEGFLHQPRAEVPEDSFPDIADGPLPPTSALCLSFYTPQPPLL